MPRRSNMVERRRRGISRFGTCCDSRVTQSPHLDALRSAYIQLELILGAFRSCRRNVGIIDSSLHSQSVRRTERCRQSRTDLQARVAVLQLGSASSRTAGTRERVPSRLSAPRSGSGAGGRSCLSRSEHGCDCFMMGAESCDGLKRRGDGE